MIVPSSNTVVEPICSRLFAGMEAQITVHYARLEVINVSLDEGSARQFTSDAMVRAAMQLAQANADAIVWNGTAGSWLGIERDRRIFRRIEKETGIKTSTASLGLVNSCRDFPVECLHLVTPYIKEINDAIIREYEALGLKISGVTGLGITKNTDIGSVTAGQMEDFQKHTGAKKPGGNWEVVCTNLAAAWRAEAIEKKTGAVLFGFCNCSNQRLSQLDWSYSDLSLPSFGHYWILQL